MPRRSGLSKAIAAAMRQLALAGAASLQYHALMRTIERKFNEKYPLPLCTDAGRGGGGGERVVFIDEALFFNATTLLGHLTRASSADRLYLLSSCYSHSENHYNVMLETLACVGFALFEVRTTGLGG
jgi:hypothetical protein